MFSEDIARKFFGKIVKCRKTRCWLWQGVLDPKGYGRFTIKIKEKWSPQLAHRISMMMHLSCVISPDVCVLHNCPAGDNPSCVNPSHLWLGSKADNNHDMIAKGRFRHHGGFKGETNPHSKLTVSIVRKIRRLVKNGVPGAEVARQLSLHHSTVYDIANGKSWSHVK